MTARTMKRPGDAVSLTHLQRLEAESIQIMREVVSEAQKPVMMYSVGKDSAVMLHLARKAFYPSPPPFPLPHVDTTWKFKAMYSPFRSEREMVRQMMAPGEFVEVHIDTPLATAEQRDVKGLYAKARAGDLKNFTGIDSPYEAPDNPEIRIDTTAMTPDQAADIIIERLLDRA